MSNQLCLNCWVFGEKASRVFPVEIIDAKNVGHLKDAIKEKKPVAFHHVDTDGIDLWQVSLHCVEASRSALELWQVDVLAEDSALSNVSLVGVEPLLSVTCLSGLFQRAPADEHVHIVIQLTST